jgi:hypothetical protein
MNSLWAILIDTSASMDEPFSGKSDFPGLIETGSYSTKLEAAKDVLKRQVLGLPRGDVAVIRFADEPDLVFKTQVKDAKEYVETIQELTAAGRTNIAAALLFALTRLGNLKIYRVISFLVISDGLSNRGDPIAAAQECADSQLPIRISTILIDPTSQGQEIAEEIVIGGDVKAVTSDKRLGKAVAEERAKHEQAIASQSTLLAVIALIAALSGLSVTISGIYTGIAERPNIAIPILFASVSTVCAGLLIYLAFAKERIERGFYPSPDAQEMYFPKRYKYSKRSRVFASIAGVVCVVGAVSLIFIASSSTATKNKEGAKRNEEVAEPDKEITERAVFQFHQRLNERDYHEIYHKTHYAFKNSMSESHAVALFEDLFLKLGTIKKSNQKEWSVYYSPDGAMLSITYDTEFTRAKATEQFVWRLGDNEATLYQYSINSPLVVTRLGASH